MKGVLLGPFIGLLGLVPPYLTKLLIDEVYPSQDISLMHIIVACTFAFSFSSALLLGIQSYYNLYLTARITNAANLLFFNHLQHLRIRFFENHQVGEIMSRFQDVGKSLQSIASIFSLLFSQGIFLFLVPPLLFLMQWKLALLALVTIPFTIIVTALSSTHLRKYWKQSSEAYAELQAMEMEALSQIRTIKSLALEHFVFNRASLQVGRALKTQVRAGLLGEVIRTSDKILNALNTALFMWLGWTFVLSQQMTLGEYIAFTSYVAYLYQPLSSLVAQFSSFQQSAIHLSRMYEYLDEIPEQHSQTGYSRLPPPKVILRGHIEMRKVYFGYTPDKDVVKDISFVCEPGSVTAIIGMSGSGKTTLLRLLSRLEEPDAGQILFDGLLSKQAPLPDVRRQVSVVWQEFGLLRGSILDNLTVGLEHPSMEEVEEAMTVCQLHEVVQSLPATYATPVAEWGSSLSSGQRQRLALARAFLRKAPIMLLDEVTSNLDLETEAELLQTFASATHGRTIVLVTHRVATAARADQICVLEKGHLVGLGTHADLLHSCEIYSRMWSHHRMDDVRSN